MEDNCSFRIEILILLENFLSLEKCLFVDPPPVQVLFLHDLCKADSLVEIRRCQEVNGAHGVAQTAHGIDAGCKDEHHLPGIDTARR